MLNFKGMRFPIDVILVCIRWYVAYPLSYRHLEEMMEERGILVDHSSINRWAIRFLPLIEKVSRKHKRPVGGSWRMDETYIKVKGCWKYLYRAGMGSFSLIGESILVNYTLEGPPPRYIASEIKRAKVLAAMAS